MPEPCEPFAGRAGLKLAAAIEAFGLGVAGRVCADFGCNVGGFTDCLLRLGAVKVYALDTGYGQLAWSLRKDPRVVVMERTNALHCPVPEPVDLVVIDVAWTPQRLVVPAALRWLKPAGAIISLLKPHYELAHRQHRKPHQALAPEQSNAVCLETCQALSGAGAEVQAAAVSVLIGKGGNREYLLLIRRAPGRPPT